MGEPAYWRQQANAYLQKLCRDIDNRCVGSDGNRQATDFVAGVLTAQGFSVEMPVFDCFDWWQVGADLTVAGRPIPVNVSPYSLGCQVGGRLVAVETVAELTAVDLTNQVLLLRGEIAAEQIMPKNFPFYNPEHHQALVRLLEAKAPLAVVAATGQDLNMVGGQYPFPLFEDGDLEIPSIYITDIEGARLAAYAGEAVSLQIRAERRPASGVNVNGRKGRDPRRRLVFFAHIDAKMGTPGALDNASGVVVLLLLAELLADYEGDPVIELVALNGEDYFSSPGEQLYLALNAGKFEEILLGINVDGVGYQKGKVAFSLYGCPPEMAASIQGKLAGHAGLSPGEPWYAGDHSLFMMNDVPALAFTSELLAEVMAEIVHTTRDTPEIIDPARLVALAFAIREVVLGLW